MFEQLPLAVQLRDDATFDNFFLFDEAVSDRRLVVKQLRGQLSQQPSQQQDSPQGEWYIYLYGPTGMGKSHLLQAACHQSDTLGLASLYLPLQELVDYSPQDLFEGLEQLELVCLDDIQCVLGKKQWEQALFNLFNRLAENKTRLLVSGDCAIRELPIKLPDLQSRLSWGSVYKLSAIGDEQQLAVFQFRAEKRGLAVNDEVAQYIYHRCQRDMDALVDVLDKLDSASLKEQRRLTVPFVKLVLQW